MKSAVLFGAALALCGCLTAGGRTAPGIVSSLSQRGTYTGEPQAFEVQSAQADAPLEITYFESFEALENGESGSPEPPVNGGRYYVRIERPEGNGYAAGPDIIAEFLIERRQVNISAEEKQEAFYDGNPKRVTAETDVPVRLSAAYFPSAETRRAATEAGPAPEQRSAALRGLTRVETPPKEPGTYYATVYFSGDRNYLPASREVEFTILRRPRQVN